MKHSNTVQILTEERKELADTISQSPCKRCKQDGRNHCPKYAKSCWELYNEEAKNIQIKFLIPLRARIKLAVTSAMALGICCCFMLMFPIHNNRHHILETYTQITMSCLKDCWPKIKKDVSDMANKIEARNAYATEKNSK